MQPEEIMNQLFEPLSDDEIDILDRFLLERIDKDADTDGKDEGVLDVSELDGLFTAIVSGPVVIQPSRWLPAVWGDFKPTWESAEDFESIVSLLVRHMNSIASMLMKQPEDFEPLFLEREVDGKTYPIVDEWCEGYVRGVALAPDQWEVGGLQMTVLLAPIRAFTHETHWYAHERAKDAEVDNIRNAITPNVREIHAYWLARRDEHPPISAPVRRAEPRVGRNDPCPCGSGKKYKRCCLH
jgi:uncharacterized protein